MGGLRNLPCLRFLVIFSLSTLCYADKDSGKDHKHKSEDEAPEVIGPAKYGSSRYWVKVKGMGFSEGNLVPDFNENKTDYTLTIHNGKAKQLLVTVQLDTDKYDLLELPVLVWNGKEMKYSPIETIEFEMALDKSIGAFSQDATLTCKDKKPGSIFAPTNSKTYKIHVTQVPDIESIVTAKSITVTGDDDVVYQAHPPYKPQTKDNEIIYFVDHKVHNAKVQVKCPAEASQLKYNGIAQPALDATYTSHEIEGASKSILAQCIYKDDHWTNGREMQRTYVVKILRNHTLRGTNVSLRVWPPDQGMCKTLTRTKMVGNREELDYSFSCMGYTNSVPLLGTYTEPKAELVIVNMETGARYRLWNGIPSHIPLVDPAPPYELHLEAGAHIRKYNFTLVHPPKCYHLDCQKGIAFKNQGYPDLFRWWSNGSATRDKFCTWDPCTIEDDFKTCCGHKGATCDSYTACMDPAYRQSHRDICPHDDDWTLNGNIIYEYDYLNQTQWTCPKDTTVVATERCAWTPCRPQDNDDGHCCATAGQAACRTISCPEDMIKKSAELNEMCLGDTCGPSDYAKCCTTRDICTSMKCPHGYSLKYNAALFMCAGERCAPTDRDQCCDSAAYCDSWTCPPLWEPKKNAAILPCGGFPCMEWDTGLCCNMKGMCSTLNCPTGYFKRDHPTTRPCAGIANRTCNLEIDLHRCCEKAAVCTESYVCDKGSGYLLKLNAKYLSCPSAKCTDTDRNLCCDMVDPFKAAADVDVGPKHGDSHEGSCVKKTEKEGAYHFECTAADGIDALHLTADFTFHQPVGNQIYFDSKVLSGQTASYPLKELPVLATGKKYTLQMHSRVAGRGVATGKISIFVNGNMEGASPTATAASPAAIDSGKEAEKSSGASDSGKDAKKSSASSDSGKKEAKKSSEDSEEKETASVLRKLTVGRQLVSASSRTCVAAAVAIVTFAQCAVW